MEGLAHDGQPSYGAYLLRYWEVRSDRPGQPSTWRFSLQKAGTEEQCAFRDLEALLAYLRTALAAASSDDNATGR